MTRLTLFALVAALQCAAACSAPPPPPPPSSAALMEPIRSAIGDAACEQSDQCRVLPVGNKPCGGPNGYLAWSTQATDANALQAAALAQAAAERRENATSGMRSTCNIVPAPSASCRPSVSDGRKTCQLDPAGRRGLD